MAETKACPKCGTTMGSRLGLYECPQCGHEEEAAKPEPAAKRSGPGIRREAWHRSQPGTGGQPPLPGQSHVPSPGTLYTPGAAPPPGLYGDDAGVRESKYSTLEAEKRAYFSIYSIVLGLAVVGLLLLGAVGDGATGFFSGVLSGAINLAITYWVLFGASANMKLTCAGCNGFWLMMMIFGGLAAMSMPEMKEAVAYGYAMEMRGQ